jgi:putative DNA primase/helicase
MADLTNILGGSWTPPAEIKADPPELQLRDAIEQSGITPPKDIVLDGKMHRFNSGTKGKGGHDKSGWYIAYGDGVPAGRFGCWRAGMEMTWRADVGRKLTPSEEMANVRRMSEAKAARDIELAKSREVASNTVEKIWSEATAAHPDHPYLSRKGIGVNGARVTGDGRLVVPLYNPNGTLSSLQYIDREGGKLYHAGGQTGGCSWLVGTMDEPGVLYVAEGYATAATIHQVTGRPCLVAYSASNLVPVTGAARDKYGSTQEIVIVADNDASNTGQKYADQASAKFGARSIMPPFQGDANDYVAAGGDLSVLLIPPVSDWLIPADEFCTKPAPIKWMVKNWIQDDALIMIHGPSGGGKTFVALDWCLHIASSLTDWNGHRVKNGTVVYLAGEGHHGLRSRISAWKQHHGVSSVNMWLSKAGCDLNTPEGYMKVVEAIRALPHPPSVIVVDTLHRFLSGDENSAQDAKTMIDACAALMREFNCSIILVHHTGVSDEAQHRARGSSAWKGALEIEISVIPAKGDGPIQIVQRKSKDAEEAKPVYAVLELVQINGWFDEDGEQVSSAVITQTEAPPETRKEAKHTSNLKIFKSAWEKSGREVREDKPYLSKSALKDYLMEQKIATTEQSAIKMVQEGQTNRLIGTLIVSEIITPHEHGWRVICPESSGQMMISKSDYK